jgi:hypothetical protein
LQWSGISPACLVVESVEVGEELVVVGELAGPLGVQVCLGLAEFVLPGCLVYVTYVVPIEESMPRCQG